MNNELEKPKLGPAIQQMFPDRQSKIDEGLCAGFGCDHVIDPKEFKDERSRQEYRISGLCQKCQNEIFGE